MEHQEHAAGGASLLGGGKRPPGQKQTTDRELASTQVASHAEKRIDSGERDGGEEAFKHEHDDGATGDHGQPGAEDEPMESAENPQPKREHAKHTVGVAAANGREEISAKHGSESADGAVRKSRHNNGQLSVITANNSQENATSDSAENE